MNKIESPSTKNALCEVWLKLVKWFWIRDFLNFVNVFSLFRNFLPTEKGRGPSFEQTSISFTQGCIVPSLVEICSVVLEKKIFLNFVNVCLLFLNYIPLEMSRDLHLNKI